MTCDYRECFSIVPSGEGQIGSAAGDRHDQRAHHGGGDHLEPDDRCLELSRPHVQSPKPRVMFVRNVGKDLRRAEECEVNVGACSKSSTQRWKHRRERDCTQFLS
jgi:hypothetical protein